MGDFNIEPQDKTLIDFCDSCKVKNLVKEPTCFKNQINPLHCIDLILTNRSRSFQNTSVIDYQSFENIFGSTLNKYAPVKQKYIRANNSPFMTKTLCQNISHRSKLHNKFLSNPTLENKIAYKKQRNKCVQLLRMEKRKYYKNLDLQCLKDNRTFWRAVKPVFSEKCATSNKIILVGSNKILNDENLVSDTINTFFTNVTKSLGIEDNYPSPCYLDDNTTPITKIINTYSNHPSIIKIK